MQKPLVSIIIPFKNTEKYIEECLASISAQTYLNFEVLAVNDHSTDSSMKIAQKIAKQDTRIQLFDNPKSGIIAALQEGYSKSSGTLITRMDADDIMTPNKIEIMSNDLLKYGKGHVALGLVKYFAENGVQNGYARYEKWLNGLTEKGTNYNEIYKECVIPSPCWMVHKTDFEQCGAFNSHTYPEDYDLAFRLYAQGLSCIPCKEILHLWRDYSTRTSRTHEHYAENHFLSLKLQYFLQLEHQKNQVLVVWGAGKKGKKIAQLLIEQHLSFHWICNNPKKIGKHIYGVELGSYQSLQNLENSQIIVTVANQIAQKNILSFLQNAGKVAQKDYFFFC